MSNVNNTNHSFGKHYTVMVDNIPNQVKKRSTLLSNVNNTNHSFGKHQIVMIATIYQPSQEEIYSFVKRQQYQPLLWQPSNSNGGQYINQVKKRSTLLSNVNNTNHSFGKHQTVMVDNIPIQVKKRSTLLSNINNTNHSFGNHHTVMVDNIPTSQEEIYYQVKKRSTLLSNVNNTNHSFGKHQIVMIDNISTKSRRDLLFCQTSTIPTTPLATIKQ